MEFVVALFLNAGILFQIKFQSQWETGIVQREQFYFRDLVIPIGRLCCTEFTGEYFWKCDFHFGVKDFSQGFGEFSCHFSSGASESVVSCIVLFVFRVKKYLKT